MPASVWIGFDSSQVDAFVVAKASANRHLILPIPVFGITLSDVKERGLYYRSLEYRDAKLWDPISGAPMSTEFAISRFLAPTLANQVFRGDDNWALFVDSDVLFRCSPERLFALRDKKYAVQVVKHKFEPANELKMDGQVQTRYFRKNWSSVMLFNCSHPSNSKLTVELINSVPGRDLHRFCWLEDDEIGELGPEWNFLVGHHRKAEVDARIVHFTEGTPVMEGYEKVDYADEWRNTLEQWVLRG